MWKKYKQIKKEYRHATVCWPIFQDKVCVGTCTKVTVYMPWKINIFIVYTWKWNHFLHRMVGRHTFFLFSESFERNFTDLLQIFPLLILWTLNLHFKNISTYIPVLKVWNTFSYIYFKKVTTDNFYSQMTTDNIFFIIFSFECLLCVYVRTWHVWMYKRKKNQKMRICAVLQFPHISCHFRICLYENLPKNESNWVHWFNFFFKRIIFQIFNVFFIVFWLTRIFSRFFDFLSVITFCHVLQGLLIVCFCLTIFSHYFNNPSCLLDI